MDAPRRTGYWWVGPVLAVGILVGLGATAFAGYYVRDDSKPLSGYDRAPECPNGFDPIFFGVTWDGKFWEPVYRCELTGEVATLTPVPPAEFTKSPTPSPKP